MSTLVPAAIRSGAAVKSQMAAFLDRFDYAGAGNVALEIFLRAIEEPDELAIEAFQGVMKGIESRFSLAADWTFPLVHHDWKVQADRRGHWKDDAVPQLIILCYVLGATRRNLPSPHCKLADYYQMMAREQSAELKKAAEEFAQSRRAIQQRARLALAAPNAGRSLEDLTRLLVDSGMSAVEMAAHLQAHVQGVVPALITKEILPLLQMGMPSEDAAHALEQMFQPGPTSSRGHGHALTGDDEDRV